MFEVINYIFDLKQPKVVNFEVQGVLCQEEIVDDVFESVNDNTVTDRKADIKEEISPRPNSFFKHNAPENGSNFELIPESCEDRYSGIREYSGLQSLVQSKKNYSSPRISD